MYKSKKELTVKNIKNKIKFTPEIKTKANQVKKIKIVWPMSGWETNNIIVGKIIRKLKKYLKYKLVFFSKLKIEAITIIMKGFKTSIGWNLGRKNRSSHLFDPFTSIPIIGTRSKAIKLSMKSKFETIYKYLIFKYERKNTKEMPINIYVKCLKKNW